LKTALMLTLGHHASAVYFDGEKAIGYEEERLNRIKSTSAYPALSIAEIEKQVTIERGSKVLVSHWFDKLDFHKESNKYFDKSHFDALVEKYSLEPVFLSEKFTHHDAHAWSVVSFLRDQFRSENNEHLKNGQPIHVIAADGYGTNQEVFSIYELAHKDARPVLLNRYYGYGYSLGLMYQYATSFCGMKENQDEYKFLGYETYINDVLDKYDVIELRRLALEQAKNMVEAMVSRSDSRPAFWRSNRSLVNTDLLGATKSNWRDIFNDVLVRVAPGEIPNRNVRIIIGHYIQELIEGVMLEMLEQYNVFNVALSGGIFYNVKLNNRIFSHVPGLFTVVPLAGDQGCGVGMYEAHIGGFKWSDLKWSNRPSFKDWRASLSAEDYEKYGGYIKYFDESQRVDALVLTTRALKNDELVNVVKSRMEFGPRALCSTTTLANPTKKNVEIINDLNDRDTVMPMAPVMLADEVCEYFNLKDNTKTVGSDKFMILTYDYSKPDIEAYGGVAHKYPDRDVWSGRPQLVNHNDTFMFNLLNSLDSKHRVLINTSFNAHGRPIVYSFDSVFDSFKFEFDKSVELGHKRPLLFLCDFDG
jgi:carbamoyltransferase